MFVLSGICRYGCIDYGYRCGRCLALASFVILAVCTLLFALSGFAWSCEWRL